GIDDMALQPIGIPHILPEDVVDFETFQLIQLFEKPIDLDHILFEFGSKGLRVEEIPHPDPDPRHLIGIGRTNPTPCRADSPRALRLLRRFVDGLVIRQDEMGAMTDDKILSDLHTLSLEMIQLLDQRSWVHDDPVPDHTERPAIENTRRNEVKHEGAPFINHGVSRIGPTLIADNRIDVAG